jgi:hypothetical protein
VNAKKAVIGFILAVAVTGFLIELISMLQGIVSRLREDSYSNYLLSHHHYWLLISDTSLVRDFFIGVVILLILYGALPAVVVFLLSRNVPPNRWQKVLTFVLSILIIPYLTFELVFEIVFLKSGGGGAGDGAAIFASVFGLPIGIILGIILPVILFAFLGENKQLDKEAID